MTLGYTVQYPYAITNWVSQNLDKTVAGTTANNIDASFNVYPLASPCALGDYVAVGANTLGSCYKSGIVVNFIKNTPATDCSFDGQVYQASFYVRCAGGLAAVDCPLQADDQGTADFTITSDNWYVSMCACPPSSR